MRILSAQNYPQSVHGPSEMARQCPAQKVSYYKYDVSSHKAIVNHLPQHRELLPHTKVLEDFTTQNSDPRRFLPLMAFLSHRGSLQVEKKSVDEDSRGSRKPVIAGQQSHADCKSNFDDATAREKRAQHETKPEKRERKAIERHDARDKKEQARYEAKLKQEDARQILHEARCEQPKGKVEPESNYSRNQEDLPLSRKYLDHASRRHTNHQPFHTSGAKNASERRFTLLQPHSPHSGFSLARENSVNHHSSRVSLQKELNALINEGLHEWNEDNNRPNEGDSVESNFGWKSKIKDEWNDYEASQRYADLSEAESSSEPAAG